MLAHSLGALGVQLEVADGLLTDRSDVDGALRTIRLSRRPALDGLAEATHTVAALRRDVLPLAEALAALAKAHRHDRAMEIDYTVTGDARLIPSAATVSLVDTARETLTGAAKHAPGEPVTMALGFTPGTVRLRVANPLTNPLPNPLPRPVSGDGGFGLTGMRERLALAGWHWRVERRAPRPPGSRLSTPRFRIGSSPH